MSIKKVSVIDISPVPKIVVSKPKRRKGQSIILTATPEKEKLETELKKKQEKNKKKELLEDRRKKKELLEENQN